MTNAMKEMQSVSNTHGDIERKLKKTPYASPVLQDYGTVSMLTMGSGGTQIDGNMENKR